MSLHTLASISAIKITTDNLRVANYVTNEISGVSVLPNEPGIQNGTGVDASAVAAALEAVKGRA